MLNQAVKRNSKRFPEDFMFRLTELEWGTMWSQIVTTSGQAAPKPTIIKYQTYRKTAVTPYAFTEQGVAMLSGVLNSDRAINMNIAIMRAFVEIRRVLIRENDVREQLRQIKERVGEHDTQLSHIYAALENLLDEKAAERKWEDRERIGFKK